MATCERVFSAEMNYPTHGQKTAEGGAPSGFSSSPQSGAPSGFLFSSKKMEVKEKAAPKGAAQRRENGLASEFSAHCRSNPNRHGSALEPATNKCCHAYQT